MGFSVFSPSLEKVFKLEKVETWPESKHRFQQETVEAVQAAIAAGRPLLLRGEPGIGKSQVARAVAAYLQIPFFSFVVDERTERDDLLYRFDPVSRLAQAQLASVRFRQPAERGDALEGKSSEDGMPTMTWDEEMAEKRFIRPGPLWWAFNRESAERQAAAYFRDCPRPDSLKNQDGRKGSSEQAAGCCSSVVLIDEIDKADPSVPNGLLESLGNHGFRVGYTDEFVELPKNASRPLVIITTNEERELPTAFLRRCFVLMMRFPPTGVDEKSFLLERARVFFTKEDLSDDVCFEVTDQLMGDRKRAEQGGVAKPGAAEFLDIARVLVNLHPGNEAAQLDRLARISKFALRKGSEAI
ncbi:MoxR family ATPase [Stieleria sp. JC731]|uniref:AAA family ATPase n=1 Tax=Pirellulaceae TaxID=2691357 RepID=UPI001E426228|nr:MoxR family ATPase [Stieleria sp. JC731]MCC9601919.1 MoxR family ATPase [Stieleria sp. JC731]